MSIVNHISWGHTADLPRRNTPLTAGASGLLSRSQRDSVESCLRRISASILKSFARADSRFALLLLLLQGWAGLEVRGGPPVAAGGEGEHEANSAGDCLGTPEEALESASNITPCTLKSFQPPELF